MLELVDLVGVPAHQQPNDLNGSLNDPKDCRRESPPTLANRDHIIFDRMDYVTDHVESNCVRRSFKRVDCTVQCMDALSILGVLVQPMNKGLRGLQVLIRFWS